LSGGDRLAAPSADESQRLDSLPERSLYPARHYRLACRLVPVDGLVVRKRGVTRGKDDHG